MAPPPSAIVTLLFTDIEGSTKLLRAVGRDLYRERLQAHAAIVGRAIEHHGGRVVDGSGDAFFAAFPFASGAVGAAVEIQRALASDPSLPRVRIGIHTGEASETDGAYIGVAVHRAARIAAAAHGGQVLVSNATAGVVDDELPDDVGLRDLGLQPLKDIPHPARLFQLEIDGLATAFPPPRTNAAPALEAEHAERRSIRAPAIAAGVALLLAVIVGAFLVSRHRNEKPAPVALTANSVGVIDLASGTVVDSIPVGAEPTHVVVDSSGVWTLNERDGTVSWIDPDTREVKRTFPVGAHARGLAPGGGGVWTTTTDERDVVLGRLDAGSSDFTDHAAVAPLLVQSPAGGEGTANPRLPRWISAATHSVWLTYLTELIRYDPQTRKATRTEAGGRVLAQVAGDDDGAWVLTPSEGGSIDAARRIELLRFDLASDGFTPTPTIVGYGSAALASHGAEAWVAREDAVLEIAADGSIARVIDARVGVPSGVAVDDDGIVWVADSSGGRVLRVEPDSGDVTVIRLNERPDGIAAGDGKVWVTVY